MKIIHIACTILVVAIAGCERQPESKQVLVTMYVERQETHNSQIVTKTNLSEISFIASSGKPISATLPLGEEYSCSMSFQIRIQEPIVEIHDLFLSSGGRKDKDIFPDDDSEAYSGPLQSAGGSIVAGRTGKPVKLMNWSYSKNRRSLDFKLFVIVEPLKTAPVHQTANGSEYEGKMYHVLQNVDPRNMRHGKK